MKHFCSLGSLCHSAQLLKINGLKKTSYPFDWIFSNISMVEHCIKDDFKLFLDKSQYSDYNTNPTLKETQCEHSFYGKMLGDPVHNIIFNHHNPLSNPKDYAYFERCVNRFRELLKSNEPKTFVMFVGVDYLAKYLDFAYFLNNHTNNHNLLIIQNIVAENQNHILYERKGSGLKIIKVETLSSTNGLEFNDKKDEAYLNEILKLHEII